MSIPCGMSLCHPQNIAYCTDGSKEFLVASFNMVSIPSRRTSALSNCKTDAQSGSRAARGRARAPRHTGGTQRLYLFQQALPHLLHVHRLFFKGEVGNHAEECRLRVKTLDILLQPLVPVNPCDCAHQGLPFILTKENTAP